MPIDEDGRQFIFEAHSFLDRPSFLLRLANSIGKPLELALHSLPLKQQEIVHNASRRALNRGLVVVTKTLPKMNHAMNFKQSEQNSRRLGRWHSTAAFGVGAIGGFFGAISLPVELPLTTAIMLRSIAAIAAEFQMDLRDPSVQLECLYILSLGSAGSAPANAEESMASAYWTSRMAFAKMSTEAAKLVVGKSAAQLASEIEGHSVPILVKFLSAIAARFEIVVSEKLMAEALPILGAMGGGVINAAFTNYFGEAARYHFGLRALENRYGRTTIEQYYHTQVRTS
jgi:hypothetical protein